ncbi:hypothetical protein D6833_12825 [Candidatus Parcubacteria bacterium]|nr:MAG: hypothetical protein D6833_12825 [Candidatus Parcubacteria bacterium]
MKRVANVTVNQPLPKDAFDFRFPENALVHHLPDASLEGHVKKGAISVWGPDDRPLGSYEDVIAGRLRQGPGWLRITLAAVRLAATLVIGGLFW